MSEVDFLSRVLAGRVTMVGLFHRQFGYSMLPSWTEPFEEAFAGAKQPPPQQRERHGVCEGVLARGRTIGGGKSLRFLDCMGKRHATFIEREHRFCFYWVSFQHGSLFSSLHCLACVSLRCVVSCLVYLVIVMDFVEDVTVVLRVLSSQVCLSCNCRRGRDEGELGRGVRHRDEQQQPVYCHDREVHGQRRIMLTITSQFRLSFLHNRKHAKRERGGPSDGSMWCSSS